MIQRLVVTATLTSLWITPAWAQFEDREGYVVMEMESTPIPGGSAWVEESELAGASGSYYTFTGNSICNGPANDPLRYDFEIRAAGVWELRLRGAKRHHCVLGQPHNNSRCEESDRTCASLGFPNGDVCPAPDQCIRTDISNDAFVFIEDSSGEYVSFQEQPASSVGGPIKLFGGGNESWGWTGARALDTNGKKWASRWELPAGSYTLVIQGRSQQFRIDRVVLFDEQGDTRGADDREETRATPPPTPDMSQDMNAADMGAADMGAPDVGAPDMGAPDMQVSDMKEADMSTSPQDMPGSDLAPPGARTPEATEEGCAVGGAGRPVTPPWALLGVLWLGWRRVNRRS